MSEYTHLHEGQPCFQELAVGFCPDTVLPRWVGRICAASLLLLIWLLAWSFSV